MGWTCLGYGQDPKIDSLKSLLDDSKVDTFQVRILNDLSYSILNQDPDQAISYGLMAREMAEMVGYDIGMAYALRHPERISRIVIMNTAGFFPPGKKRLPFRLWLVRNIRPFATVAVLGFNLFADRALFVASNKGLSKAFKSRLFCPYN